MRIGWLTVHGAETGISLKTNVTDIPDLNNTLFREERLSYVVVSSLLFSFFPVSSLLFFSPLFSFHLFSFLFFSSLPFASCFFLSFQLLWRRPAELNRLQHSCTTQWGPHFFSVFFFSFSFLFHLFRGFF